VPAPFELLVDLLVAGDLRKTILGSNLTIVGGFGLDSPGLSFDSLFVTGFLAILKLLFRN
jgi:hypothetical protein